MIARLKKHVLNFKRPSGTSRGILNSRYRKEDQEAELARFQAKLLESRKTTLIPALMERIGKYREEAAESRNRVSTAEKLGFSKEAAVILEVDGQLSMHLEKLSKLGPDELNKNQLKTLVGFFDNKMHLKKILKRYFSKVEIFEKYEKTKINLHFYVAICK